MKKKAYIYPNTARLNTGVYNPYLDNFIQSIENQFIFVNKNSPSKTGIIDVLKYYFRIRYLFLNWVENLPDKKGGIFQSIIYLIILYTKKITGLKIVWTLHNKFSHATTNLFWKKLIFKQLVKKSDLIITHASDGIAFAEELCPGAKSRIFYFQHPIIPISAPSYNGEKIYDFLVWGTIAPYKGIDIFLEQIESIKINNPIKVLIAGKCLSPTFREKIFKYANENCIILDKFLDHDELTNYINKSHVILFTYSSPSVLSSGALIDSIGQYANIVGPDIGAFKDLGQLGIINTYQNFNELPAILDTLKNSETQNDLSKRIDNFIEENSWEKFGIALTHRIENTIY